MRNISGFLLLDKPAGISSNKALQIVKRLFKARKAGHTGSLDPIATGMLPICFGEATKFSRFLLNADKVYEVVARLGIKTDTGDTEGQVLHRLPLPSLTNEKIDAVLAKFLGDIEQIPPMYSALKHKGKRLYELARQGIEVERPPRQVSIYALQLIAHTKDTLSLRVHCSKGTYIRTLVEDIGDVLCCGAHVEVLRRLEVGHFQSSEMYDLPQLEAIAAKDVGQLDQCIFPVEALLTMYPAIHVDASGRQRLYYGQNIHLPKTHPTGWVRLYDDKAQFLGLGEVLMADQLVPRRLLAAQ